MKIDLDEIGVSTITEEIIQSTPGCIWESISFTERSSYTITSSALTLSAIVGKVLNWKLFLVADTYFKFHGMIVLAHRILFSQVNLLLMGGLKFCHGLLRAFQPIALWGYFHPMVH